MAGLPQPLRKTLHEDLVKSLKEIWDRGKIDEPSDFLKWGTSVLAIYGIPSTIQNLRNLLNRGS